MFGSGLAQFPVMRLSVDFRYHKEKTLLQQDSFSRDLDFITDLHFS